MDGEEEILVGLRAHQVSGGVIGQDDYVGSRLELGFSEKERHFFQRIQEAPHLVGSMADQRRKFSVPAMW